MVQLATTNVIRESTVSMNLCVLSHLTLTLCHHIHTPIQQISVTVWQLTTCSSAHTGTEEAL